jgi:hypothetical protein
MLSEDILEKSIEFYEYVLEYSMIGSRFGKARLAIEQDLNIYKLALDKKKSA